MYTDFYGFEKLPFSITPDPKFVYYSQGHHEALAQMLYGIQERKCLMVCTGEVGVGKTTMIFTLMSHLGADTTTSLIFDTHVDVPSMYKYMFADFGIDTDSDSRADNTIALKRFLVRRLEEGKRTLLILDEAHNLRPEIFHEVVHLTNFETRNHKLIQIVLVGQPELKAVLNSMEFRQLKQRINLRTYIKRLGLDDTRAYIRHRIAAAGGSDAELFASDAQALIHSYSRGLPRMINTLCDNALLLGFTRKQRVIDASLIQETYSELMDISDGGEQVGYDDEDEGDEAAPVPASFPSPIADAAPPRVAEPVPLRPRVVPEPIQAVPAPSEEPDEDAEIEPEDDAGESAAERTFFVRSVPPAADDSGEATEADEKAAQREVAAGVVEPIDAIPTDIPILRLNDSSARELMPALVTDDPAAKRQYHLLSTRMDAIARSRELKTLVVTSSVPQEGKTITALNLAFTFAQESSSRILLVDGDLRQPALHTYLGFRQTAGASEVMQGTLSTDKAFHRLEFPNLYVMFAGKQPPDPLALLESGAMANLLNSLRPHFDYIIVDSPPVVPIADSCVLAGQVDGVVLVVRSRQTDREVVVQAIEDLNHSNLLGIVFNSQRTKFNKSKYNYGYGYLDQGKTS